MEPMDRMAPTGADGRDAQPSSLIAVTPEEAGANCEVGGQRIDWGLDDDWDQVLDASEIDATAYVCSGSDALSGDDGLNALVSTTPEPAGANCAAGGQRLDWGLDDDEDGVLDAGEVDGSTYLCGGVAGANSLLAVTPEPDGVNCEAGGQRLDHGIDDNGNGVLDPAEIDGTSYICDGVTPRESCLVDFESAYAEFGGGDPTQAYGEFGLTFEMDAGAGLIGGDANGDVGNWSDDATSSVPTAAWGLYDFGDSTNRVQFDFRVDYLALDLRNGPVVPGVDAEITVEVYYAGVLQHAQVHTLPGPITVEFPGPIDRLVSYISDGTAVSYIIDDLRYEAWDVTCPDVPE